MMEGNGGYNVLGSKKIYPISEQTINLGFMQESQHIKKSVKQNTLNNSLSFIFSKKHF